MILAKRRTLEATTAKNRVLTEPIRFCRTTRQQGAYWRDPTSGPRSDPIPQNSAHAFAYTSLSSANA